MYAVSDITKTAEIAPNSCSLPTMLPRNTQSTKSTKNSPYSLMAKSLMLGKFPENFRLSQTRKAKEAPSQIDVAKAAEPVGAKNDATVRAIRAARQDQIQSFDQLGMSVGA